MIKAFTDSYFFLSNFYNSPVEFEGLVYQNTEAAFQSIKVINKEDRKDFCNLNPSQAKLKGRRINLRPDWEEVKDIYMYRIVKNKFLQNPKLKNLLIKTGDEELEEGNTWHDNYWGNCYCSRCKNILGKNKLGIILMQVREEFK